MEDVEYGVDEGVLVLGSKILGSHQLERMSVITSKTFHEKRIRHTSNIQGIIRIRWIESFVNKCLSVGI